MNKGIYWLASYPKSGNTWFRIVLSLLLKASKNNTPHLESVNLNQIEVGAIGSDRQLINRALGFDCALLSADELEGLRPTIYQWYGEQTVHYFKIHDAYYPINNQDYIIPTKGCLGVLYFIRNPLDVAISFAHHLGCGIDQIIEVMAKKDFTAFIGDNRPSLQLRQRFFSWSAHVESWVNAENLSVLPIRYEDMHSDSLATFQQAFNFLNLAISPDLIQLALDQTKIEKLQAQEAQTGFKEKPPVPSHFFRKGIRGDWENTLTVSQVERIIAAHEEMMFKFGYLDNSGKPIRVQEIK